MPRSIVVARRSGLTSGTLPTVVTITGHVDSINVDAVAAYTQRFILAKDPLIFDITGASISAADAVCC